MVVSTLQTTGLPVDFEFSYMLSIFLCLFSISTANERLDDEQLNPVSLRIVSSIAATTATNHRHHSDSSSTTATMSTMEPVLMLIHNKELGVLIHTKTEDEKSVENNANAALRIYGKDFKTKQWSNLLFPPHSTNEEETPVLFHSDGTTPTTIPKMIQSKKDDIVYGTMPFYDFEDHLESSSDTEFKDWMVNIAVDDFVHSFSASSVR